MKKKKKKKSALQWKFSVRTDLAIENKEQLEREENSRLDGVEVEQRDKEDIHVTHVKIVDEEGSRLMGKPMGNYITIEADKMKENDIQAHERIMEVVSENIRMLIDLEPHATILVVGLGNWNITPDALGPKVISKILVTRHICDTLSEDIHDQVRSVAAISPGVMGITGIETGEIVKAVTKKLKPSLVIAIDALAARKFTRINTTIQMSDTGINPGAGVGNKRMLLSKETLGVPVLAIGVPTVVDAATLVNDTMDRMLEDMKEKTTKGSAFYQMLSEMDTEEKYQLITEILTPYAGNMFVTPKEVDAVVNRLANIIANAVNISLHPGITMEDINRYVY